MSSPVSSRVQAGASRQGAAEAGSPTERQAAAAGASHVLQTEGAVQQRTRAAPHGPERDPLRRTGRQAGHRGGGGDVMRWL